MKERPILFSASMVRALLAGRKTQTRRVIKLPHSNPLGQWEATTIGGEHGGRTTAGKTIPLQGGIWHTRTGDCLMCPYGQPGDRLWVRETFAIEHSVEYDQEPPHKDGRPVKWSDDPEVYRWLQPHYRATDPIPGLSYEDSDEPQCRWKPSIFMPRWACRILLEVVSVRVERLQNISEADAIAEGVEWKDNGHGIFQWHGAGTWNDYAKDAYRFLWNSINSNRPTLPHNQDSKRYARVKKWLDTHPDTTSWDANPWVWVVEFRRLP